VSEKIYSFNQQDYEFTLRIFNGKNDVFLTMEAWEDLLIEEDIFDWKMKGSVVIKTPYESFELESDESNAATGLSKEKSVYKFRNDGRDTIFISIKPKQSGDIELKDSVWRLELEAVIYDTEDLSGTRISDKAKKLFFWDKTYQFMIECNSDFSTATSGVNKGKKGLDQMSNSEKSMKTGECLGELLKSRPEFEKHAKNVPDPNNTDKEAEKRKKQLWDVGSEKVKLFYSSPVYSKYIDDLEYLLNYCVSSEEEGHQPCIFKLERAEKTMKPKQFTLKSIRKYFEKAGKKDAKDYQIEHLYIESQASDAQPHIEKAPVNKNEQKEIKANRYSVITSYQMSDMSGLDYSQNLTNYRVVSFNSSEGQFNEESKSHGIEEYKNFYKDNIFDNVLTKNKEERLNITKYLKDGMNTKTVYSLRSDELGRLADGKNRLLKHYLFSNMAITFTILGMTLRQPGRFFGLSKMGGNNKEYDSKIEGQYFVTNVVHHFNNAQKTYNTQVIGVKTHTYKEETKFEPDDVIIIK
jgi:hypothetical protein